MTYERKVIKVSEVTNVLQEEYDSLKEICPGRLPQDADIYTNRIFARMSELRLVAMLLKIDLEV